MGVRHPSNRLESSDSQMSTATTFGQSVREGETALCLDCLVTFNVRHRFCPKCGSEQFWLMAKWTQARARTRPVAVPFPEPVAIHGPIRFLRPAS
jgi:NADH pyrophosphatase NudC (nudix superfamily)